MCYLQEPTCLFHQVAKNSRVRGSGTFYLVVLFLRSKGQA